MLPSGSLELAPLSVNPNPFIHGLIRPCIRYRRQIDISNIDDARVGGLESSVIGDCQPEDQGRPSRSHIRSREGGLGTVELDRVTAVPPVCVHRYEVMPLSGSLDPAPFSVTVTPSFTV